MKEMIFQTKQELMSQLAADDACEEGYAWAAAQGSLEDILEGCPLSWRVWALSKGYDQFAAACPLSQLDGRRWAWLLRERPELAEHCPWSKCLFGGYDWVILLLGQPQFAGHCTRCSGWVQLDGHDWACLLRRRSGFAEQCTACGGWAKLTGQSWYYLLQHQPQLAKYCPNRYSEQARAALAEVGL